MPQKHEKSIFQPKLATIRLWTVHNRQSSAVWGINKYRLQGGNQDFFHISVIYKNRFIES